MQANKSLIFISGIILTLFFLAGLTIHLNKMRTSQNTEYMLLKPIGNPILTSTKQQLDANIGPGVNGRFFLSSLGVVDESGVGPRNYTGSEDRVGQYVGVRCVTSGGGACWGQNILAEASPGFSLSNGFGVSNTEMDINNFDVDTGEKDGEEGLGWPLYSSIGITGAGSKRSTAALLIGGPGDHAIFNRGIAIYNNSVRQSTIADYGSSEISIDIRGQHGVGVDAHRMKGGANFLAANGNGLFFEDSTGNGAFQGMVGDSKSQVVIGFGSASILLMQSVVPGTTDTSLGKNSQPWRSAFVEDVYASNYHQALRTPSSSKAPCTAGDFVDDSNFHYVCVSESKWKRVALSSF